MKAFEVAADVGGTWYWNRYPGARCDVESLSYQYSFSRELMEEWTWSERYATQPEILSYAQWVADRLDLRRDITFRTRIERAVWDEEGAFWQLTTSTGRVLTARFLIAAAGALSAVSLAPFPGANDFGGDVLHTGAWPTDGFDFTGKRVAVIGTGSSGVQLIPEVAKEAAELIVFQRTPAYTIPARNRPLYDDEILHVRRHYEEVAQGVKTSAGGMYRLLADDKILETSEHRRRVMLEKNWKLGGNSFLGAFTDVRTNLEANHIVSEFVRAKIRDIVLDPETARKLTPMDYPIGSKRLITDTNYYATFNLPHVTLVSVRDEPIERIVPEGVQTSARTYPIDAIVHATGYDSATGALTRIDVRGRDGVALKDSWAEGAHTYLGIATAGFPNLFTITGPQSPSVLANMFASIEQHVDWTVRCLEYLRDRGVVAIESTPPVEQWWDEQVEDAVRQTLYLHANSWYRGSNIEDKPSQFLVYTGGLDRYRRICDEVADDDYRGFRLRASSDAEEAAA